MYAIPTAGVAFAAAVLPALVQAQAVAPGSVPDFTLGGAASTVTVAGIQPFTYYSATVPGFPKTTITTVPPPGAIATPIWTTTQAWPSSPTTVITEYKYYSTLGGTTYTINQPVPLSVWAPGFRYPCPTGFYKGPGDQCYFCPEGFYWDITSCVRAEIILPLDCNDGYVTTNTAGHSSCVPTTTATTTTSSTLTLEAGICHTGYSTYVSGDYFACASGTVLSGAAAPVPTLGGPVTTITTAGITYTEYSAALAQSQPVDVTTLTGSPTATITVGGGSSTFSALVGIPLTTSGPDIFQQSTLVLTTESLGSVTVTLYQTLKLPEPDALFPSSLASSSSLSINPGGPIINATSFPTTSSVSYNPGGPIINATTFPTTSGSTSISINPGGPIINATSFSGFTTTTSGTTSVSSAAASASATPYKGGAAGSGNVNLTAALSMLGALLITSIAIM